MISFNKVSLLPVVVIYGLRRQPDSHISQLWGIVRETNTGVTLGRCCEERKAMPTLYCSGGLLASEKA